MAAPAPSSIADSLGSVIPITLAFGAAMWFLSIRPAMKRQKEQEELQKGLKKGDKVLTQAGFFGHVDRVEDNGNVIVRVSDGTKLEFQRQAILSKVQEG